MNTPTQRHNGRPPREVRERAVGEMVHGWDKDSETMELREDERELEEGTLCKCRNNRSGVMAR